RIGVRLPGAARRRNFGVGAARRAAVVPDDQHVRAAVAANHVGELAAIRPAGDVTHGITHLVFLAVSWAGRVHVETVWVLKALLLSFDEWPEQRGGRFETRQRQIGRQDAVVVRRPPNLLRPRPDGRRSQGLTTQVRAALPIRAKAIMRNGSKRVVV